MKKLTILFLFLFKLSCVEAQSWIKGACDTTAWHYVDTLNKYSDSAGWVYSPWYDLAGLVPDSSHRVVRREKQKRIGKTSGWLMERTRTTEWLFKPKEKTEFEKIIDSVSK